MKVLLTGNSCTGKSVKNELAALLSEKLGIPHGLWSAGDDFREVAKSLNISLEEFLKRTEDNERYDRLLDEKIVRYCEETENFVMDSRMAPVLARHRLHFHEIYTILLTCDDLERIPRLIKREFLKKFGRTPTEDEVSERFESARQEALLREAHDANRYWKLYRIPNIFADEYVHAKLDTTGMTRSVQAQAMLEIVLRLQSEVPKPLIRYY